MIGQFITIEGIEGAGKTSCIGCVERLLTRNNIEYITTREPGGTNLAEKIRHILLEVKDEPPVDLCELLLIFAGRAQHIHNVILPALNAGIWVVCDRFTDATFAYQGGGRGLKTELISDLELITQKDLRPNITFLLDVEPELGLSRAKKRGELDRFEKEELEFFKRVREAYLDAAIRNAERFFVLDASESEEQVARTIQKTLLKKFSLKNE